MRYRLRLAPLANLVYQLDCIAGVIFCARPVFDEFWQSRLENRDRALLTRWKQLRLRHTGTLELANGAPEGVGRLLGPAYSYDLQERQRLVGFRAKTLGEYQAGMSLLGSDEDAAKLAQIARVFEPRFEHWWRQEGFSAGRAFLERLQPLMADPFFDQTFVSAAQFYRADLPKGTIFPVHIVVQPASKRRLAVAYQLEGQGIVEAPFDGDPTEIIDVLAHELFHYLFFRMEPGARARLIEAVVSSADEYAVASYGMLDEAVAAALGNGLVARHFLSPERYQKQLDRGLIHYRAAGAVAVQLLPLLEDRLSGLDLTSREFVEAFMAAARRTYPDGAPRPIDYLHSPVLIVAPEFTEASSALKGESWAGHPYLREFSSRDPAGQAFVAEHPLISVAYLIRPRADSQSSDWLLPSHLRGVVRALPRTQKSYTFAFIARDAEAMGELVSSFARLRAMKLGTLVEVAHDAGAAAADE